MQFIDIFPVMNTPEIYKQPMSLALAHLVEKYPSYTRVFEQYPGYKILDNSVIELGSTVSMERLVEDALAISADEIILPDVLHDKNATLKMVKQNIQWLKRTHPGNDFSLMAVIQGDGRTELEECFNAYLNIPEINVIGIPKWTNELLGGRVSLESLWVTNKGKKKIHLLGCWTTLAELLQYDRPELIRSCDSSLRCLNALNKRQQFARRKEGEVIDLEGSWMSPMFCNFDRRGVGEVKGL